VYRELASSGSFNASGAFSGTDFLNSNSAHVIYNAAAGGSVPNLRVVRSNLRW
jgi:hypothetical protein